jgi:sortase (surface protein transpeptidase)
VLGGHVSDDHDSPGAFHRLWGVRPGMTVTTHAHGVTRAWRVTSVRRVSRDRLDRGLFAQSLARRLVLVTCADRVSHGGWFHYTTNEVVVAVPLRR